MLTKMPFSQCKCDIIKYAYDDVYLTFLSIGFHKVWVMEKDSIAEKVSIATKPKPPSLEMCLRLDTRAQSCEYEQLPLLGCSSSLLQQYTFLFTAFSFSFLNNLQNGGSCLKDASKAIK